MGFLLLHQRRRLTFSSSSPPLLPLSHTDMSYTDMSYKDMSYTDVFLAYGRTESLPRASCSPNASQQSIWGSLGGAEEAVCANIRGVDPSRKCTFSLCRDEISNPHRVSSKGLMFTKY